MTIPIATVRRLCTATELTLVSQSRRPALGGLSASKLDQLIQRARRLRDTYRDKARQQRREQRGKSAPKGARAAQGNDATVKKEQIFAEALTRFQERRAAL